MKSVVYFVFSAVAVVAVSCSKEPAKTTSSSRVQQAEVKPEATPKASVEGQGASKEQVIAFAKSKKLLSDGIDDSTLTIKGLSDYTGDEKQCAYFELAKSYICVQDTTIFADGQIEGSSEGWRNPLSHLPPVRIHLPTESDRCYAIHGGNPYWQTARVVVIGLKNSGALTSNGQCEGSAELIAFTAGASYGALIGALTGDFIHCACVVNF